MRLQIFSENLKYYESHNSEDGVTYKLGINQFTDLTQDEIKLYKGYNFDMNSQKGEILLFDDEQGNNTNENNDDDDENRLLLDYVDWRQIGAVSDVKDQGSSCSGCWAFSSAGAIESHFKIQYGGPLMSLSV